MTTDDRIKPGERVLTSGGDQVYPRGLPVGVVEHVVPDPDHDGYVAVVVKTAANLSRLEEVLVITELSETNADGGAAGHRSKAWQRPTNRSALRTFFQRGCRD